MSQRYRVETYRQSHGVLTALIPASLKMDDSAPAGPGVDDGRAAVSSSEVSLTLTALWDSVWDAVPPIILAVEFVLPGRSAVVSFPFSTVARRRGAADSATGLLEREAVRGPDPLRE